MASKNYLFSPRESHITLTLSANVFAVKGLTRPGVSVDGAEGGDDDGGKRMHVDLVI